MFELEDDYILLDDKEVAVVKEKNSNRHYFADRVAIRGELNYGLVPEDTEVKISLNDNGIDTPIIIDSIVAMSGDTTADELIFTLYRLVNGVEVRVGIQRYSNSQMPTDFPDGVIYPDMIVGVKPTRGDSTVVVYCKPVKVIFQATP